MIVGLGKVGTVQLSTGHRVRVREDISNTGTFIDVIVLAKCVNKVIIEVNSMLDSNLAKSHFW